MQLTDILHQTGGLQSMARELGIGEADVARAASAMGPAILGGFQKQVQQHPQGVGGLGGLLSQLGGGGLLDSVLSTSPTDTSAGDNVLGQIFGSKDVSRAVAQNAATHSGLDPALLKKMLPMLAMVAAGFMAKQHASAPAGGGGGLGSLLGGLLGGGGSSAGGLGALLGGGGGSGTGAQGNPLDDILGALGKR